MTKKLAGVLLAAVLLAAVLLGGCYAGAVVTPTPFAGQTETAAPGVTRLPQSGGEITIPMPAEPYTTHPLFIRQTEMSNIYSMLFEPLIAIDEKMLPAVSIANSWEFDTESDSVIVRLRSGVRFHDNTELTASDVVFTFNTILDSPDSTYYSTVSKYILSAEATDAYTVRFEVKKACYAVYYSLSVPIIPESVYSGVPAQTDITPVGSGGFAVASMSMNPASMVMVRNTYWWKKQPYIERIRAVGYSDNAAAISAFINGELDCVPTAIYTTDIYDGYSGVSCYSYMSNYYDFIAPNFKNAILRDVNIRRAISYAIDRKSIIANIYISHGISMEYPFASDLAFNNTDIPRYDYSLAAACELLEEAGWTPGEDGIREKGGKRLSFRLITLRSDDNPVRRDTAAMIKRQLAYAGIELQVETLNAEQLNAAIEDGAFDLALTGYYLSGSPDVSFAVRTGGVGNIMGYSDAVCDGLLHELDSARTREEYAEVYGRLQQYVAQQLPQIGLIGFSHTLLHRDSVVPTGINRDLRVYENIDKWYIDKDK